MALSTSELQKLSWRFRSQLLDIVFQNDGHFGGPLSCLDIINVIYNSGIFNFSTKTPKPSDDNFVLSAGHLAISLYLVLAYKKYFPSDILSTYSHYNSILQGHVSTQVPGVLYSSGSLGQGLSFAAGLSLANLLDKKKKFTICLTSDAEHQQGQIWEAVMFANKYNLYHLINIVDYNQYQIDGSTDQIMPLEDLAAKYIRFGWSVREVDGHNFSKLINTLSLSKQSSCPVCVIAHTTFAKGVAFAHFDYQYHDVKNLHPNLYHLAKNEIAKHIH